MKNKGFAVSAALYGMVVLFVVVMFGLLNMFKDYRSINKDYVNDIKESLNSAEANIISPSIVASLNSQTVTDLGWYPYLLKLTITINNQNEQTIMRTIKLSTPPDIAISSSAYKTVATDTKIKSCRTAFAFGTAQDVSRCEGDEYNLVSGSESTLNQPHEDEIIAENDGALYFNSNDYFLIGPVNLIKGDNTFVFYLRTTVDYQTFYNDISTNPAFVTLTY